MTARSRSGTLAGLPLRIDTSDLDVSDKSGILTANEPSSARTPRSRGRARALSQAVLPSFLSPTPTSREKHSPSPSPSPSPQPSAARQRLNRALNESRKLLAHVLHELEARTLPPSVFDAFKFTDVEKEGKGLAGVVETVRNAAVFKSTKPKESQHARTLSSLDDTSEDEDAQDTAYNTDVTFGLMTQFREVLVIMQAQGWKVFDSDFGAEGSESIPSRDSHEKHSSTFRFRRSSFQTSARRSRSVSPSQSYDQTSELLHRCMSILASVVSEDCRFQVSAPKPSRPPNALQMVTLEVAKFLVHANQHRPDLLYEIAMNMLPAFTTFRTEMQARLLIFFEENLLRGILEALAHAQGTKVSSLEIGLSKTHYTSPEGHGATTEPIVEIQVEEPDDSGPLSPETVGWTQWSLMRSDMKTTVSATNAPYQSLNVYYSAAIVAPLLTALFDNVDFSSFDLPKMHRVSRLIGLIVNTKVDSCLDVLELVAYHSGRARNSAISVLATFWPRALGHVLIANPPTIFSYEDSVRQSDPRQIRKQKQHHMHQFIPWSFTRVTKAISLEARSVNDCSSCAGNLLGFGLLCPFCMCAVHFDCYDPLEGNALSSYPTGNDASVEKVTVHRYSYLMQTRSDMEPDCMERGQHHFRLVNIFTMCLCFVCRQPLWGTVAQGYKCTHCNFFIHEDCLSNDCLEFPPCRSIQLDPSYFTVDWAVMRTSFIDFYGKMLFPEQELSNKTYEEVSVISSTLWTQLQLLRHGITSGTILIVQATPQKVSNDGFGIDDFELQYFVKLYEAYLQSGRLPVSLTIQGFVREGGRPISSHQLMFDWQTLSFITSIIKQPISSVSTEAGLANLLSVEEPSYIEESSDNEHAYPLYTVTLAHLRDILGLELNFHNDYAACLLLSHLHHLGFFDCQTFPSAVFKLKESATSRCVFSIPLGLDLSSDVETLVTAIEVCLGDLDVSTNEIGYLLLVRKLWPSSMSSEYALERLMRVVLAWILAEDDNLAIILRDYVAQGRPLPGIPLMTDTQLWPRNAGSHSNVRGSNNAGKYIVCRKSLLSWYASPWLLSVHDQDTLLYSKLLYKLLAELAEDSVGMGSVDDVASGNLNETAQKEKIYSWADYLFRSISKLLLSSVAFTVVDDLMKSCLTAMSSLGLCHHPNLSLARLINREQEGSYRTTVVTDITNASNEQDGLPSFDPWRVMADIALENIDGLRRSLEWLCLFASSGVDIPIAIFKQLSALSRDFNASFVDSVALVEAALLSVSTRTLSQQELQAVMSELHSRYLSVIIGHIRKKENLDLVYRFIRQSLATCLLLYGCNRSHLIEIGMIEEKEKNKAQTRRRAPSASDPIVMDIDLIGALSQYIVVGNNEICLLVAQFLTCFVTEAKFLEPYEVDNFILKNSHFLTDCVWCFYDSRDPRFSSLRIPLLLRLLVIDGQPFENLLQDEFQLTKPWERRLKAASHLFSMILDINSPLFAAEGHQWKPSVTLIFRYFFTCLWGDDREEIRWTTETWSKTLLPSHMEAISSCWNESLVKSPISDRVNLVTFLVELRYGFSSWKVLSWDVIIETLLDLQRNGESEVEPASAHLSMFGISAERSMVSNILQDPHIAGLQRALILLSLNMIADGITVDVFSFLRIKFHLLTLLGFEGVTILPAPNGQSFHVQYGNTSDIPDFAFPCIRGLVELLDACHDIELAPSAMIATEDNTASKHLVGSVVVDVALSLVNQTSDLVELPFLTARALLKAIAIIIHKHDLETEPLRHLRDPLRKAVKKTTDLLLVETALELRELAMSISQSYLNRWPLYASNILIHQLQTITKLFSTIQAHGDDVLATQAMSFLESTFSRYASSGLFYQLCKRDLDDDFFAVLRHITRTSSMPDGLRDTLLRDTLTQIVQQPNESAQHLAMENLKKYIQMVHHQGYSPDLLQFVGRCLSTITRNASELSAEGFDPNPLLLITATLLQHNKSSSRAFIGYTETLFRIALGRFDVDVESLRRLLQVTSVLSRRAPSQSPGDEEGVKSISPLSMLLDVVYDALRGRTRVSALTLTAIVEALLTESTNTLTSSGLAYLSIENLLRVAKDAFFYLQTAAFPETYAQKDLAALLNVASLALRAMDYDDGFLSRQLREQELDRGGKIIIKVRAWNMLTLSALQSTSSGPASAMLSNLDKFTGPYWMSLRIHILSRGLPADLTAADVNHAYVGLKTWLLLTKKSSHTLPQRKNNTIVMPADQRQLNEDEYAWLIWNELWPPFDRLISQCEVDVGKKDVSPVATLIWSSIADIFLFLRQMRSVLALETSLHVSTLMRVKALGLDEATTRKLSRAVTSMSEPLPDITFEALVDQAAYDLLAAEKLLALEMRREVGWNTMPSSR